MTAARFLIAATAVLGCGVLVMSCGTAERAPATGAPVADAPPPMELKPLLIDPTLASVRSALVHPDSAYPVRLEGLRQARRLRDPRLAPLVHARVENSRDPFEQAVALDVWFDIAPDDAARACDELAERCAGDAVGEAALASAIVARRCTTGYPLAMRLLVRDAETMFHLRSWIRSAGAPLLEAMRPVAGGPAAGSTLALVLASRLTTDRDLAAVAAVVTSAGFPRCALRALSEEDPALALPVVRAAFTANGEGRDEAIDLLGELADAESADAILALLHEDPQLATRAACLRALGRIHAAAALPDLLDALRNRTAVAGAAGGTAYPIVDAAADGLSAMPQPEAAQALYDALAHDDRPYAIQAAANALANRHDRAAIPALEAAYARMAVSAPRVADACGSASDALRRGSSEHALAYLIAYRSAGQALTILTEVPLLPAGIAGEARWGISAPDAAAQESFALPVEDIPRAIQARNSRRLDRLHYLGCAIDVVDLVAR